MANIRDKAIAILEGNLNFGHSYLITTVPQKFSLEALLLMQLYACNLQIWLFFHIPMQLNAQFSISSFLHSAMNKPLHFSFFLQLADYLNLKGIANSSLSWLAQQQTRHTVKSVHSLHKNKTENLFSLQHTFIARVKVMLEVIYICPMFILIFLLFFWRFCG